MSKKCFTEKGLDLENYSDQSLLLGLFPVCLVPQVCPVRKEKGCVGIFPQILKLVLTRSLQMLDSWGHHSFHSMLWRTSDGWKIVPFKLDSQVDHSLRAGLGSQGLREALEVLGVLALQAHPAERPWVTTCHPGVDITTPGKADTTSSEDTAKKRRGGRSETRVSWAAGRHFSAGPWRFIIHGSLWALLLIRVWEKLENLADHQEQMKKKSHIKGERLVLDFKWESVTCGSISSHDWINMAYSKCSFSGTWLVIQINVFS